MKNLTFQRNWNNKLFCPCFSTIRWYRKDFYKIAEEVVIIARIDSIEYNLGIAKIAAIEKYKVSEIPQNIAFYDTEKTVSQFVEYFFSIYETYIKNKNDVYCTVLYLVWSQPNFLVSFTINKEFILPISA